MADSLVLHALAAAGAISVLLFAARCVLDQLPELIRSWRRVRRAVRGTRDDNRNTP
ncbi:hypothetical protein ACFQVC_05195 [Streptomyces monticola]|uniref:Cellulose biosynthesis protein BcsF n=1 Tax=Streptomyces monticola TaxID=2666263 RepID=A0ABW2JC96_9ACTN